MTGERSRKDLTGVKKQKSNLKAKYTNIATYRVAKNFIISTNHLQHEKNEVIHVTKIESFINEPSLDCCWRAIILFGNNVASYKFALAKCLLELADKETTFISLEDLADPFSAHISEHMKHSDKQATSASSKFLQKCRDYNNGKITKSDLNVATVSLGFNNVIDAFHRVNRDEIPIRFYEDRRKDPKTKGIVVTDELLRLKESIQFENLAHEAEARWRLVETSWELGVSRNSLAVSYDSEAEILFNPNLRRTSITSCRDALNGYQKGKCFYCFEDISVDPYASNLADVDHYFPHTLKQVSQHINIDGVWNLVLACKDCNRGIEGKSAKVPSTRLLNRLSNRNDYLISSHHPLRETLIEQTGKTEATRKSFLREQDRFAINHLIHRWEPKHEKEACF